MDRVATGITPPLNREKVGSLNIEHGDGTPLFAHPLHTLLDDLGFNEGDGMATFVEQEGTVRVSLTAPSGYTLECTVPDGEVSWQLTIIRRQLTMFLLDTDDMDDALIHAMEHGVDDPQEWRDMMAATRIWADIQTNRIDEQGSMLCALMHLDPYTLSREDFLRGMWRSLLGGGSGVLFTLMDEYLNVNDREFTQWPHADHATMEVA